jgi:2,3-bisphosphoglycerate-independent phosphoglycerate mutase
MNSADRVLLMILDGYGHSDSPDNNAISLARKPNLDKYMKTCPHSLIEASGTAVGLPKGVMGNSEVGHLNIGGGRVIKQELTKIADFAKESGFESLPDVKRALCDGKGAVHLMGLLSDGGVHSHQEHLYLLLEAAAHVHCIKPVYIHIMTDGRDTPPQSALDYITELKKTMARTRQGRVATVVGRYYIMDRDKRWERTETAYKALVSGEDFPEFLSADQAVRDAYEKNENDEFIKPRIIKGGARIRPEDSVIFFNFRADRARQLSRALALPGFKEFATPVKLKPENYVTFTRYDETFPFPALFPPVQYKNILGELVSAKGEKQLRIAETEKYAHVTYFFNGGEEKVYPGEDRALVPSPKEVATYDLKPEMSARALTDELLKKMRAQKYKLIVLNYANGDMVGHTGAVKAAVKAVEVMDECIGRACEEALAQGYHVLITADHGNCEQMVDPVTAAPHTAHSTNPVPLIWIAPEFLDGARGAKSKVTLHDGKLADIAPTILDLWGWAKPDEMTGVSLIQR